MHPRGPEVVVAGAGPAGCAAAIALARGGRRVLVADPSLGADRELRVGESLPAVASAVMRDLGLPELDGAGVAIPSTGTTAAWGTGPALERDAVGDPHGRGWHLARPRFDDWMRARARAAGAELVQGRVLVEAPGLRVEGPHGMRIAPRWVVDATGRRAAIARRRGARRERHDRLVALYAALPTRAADVDARTRLEAMPAGWWYSTLAGRGRRIVAFLTDSDLVDPDMRSTDGFLAALGRTRHVAPAARALASEPRTTAAHGARPLPAAGAGWLAVGDAALAFDPLSSQGILNALVTGLEGAAAVEAGLRGESGALEGYARRLDEVWRAYERNRAQAYAIEDRWPDAAFWGRRAYARTRTA